MASKTRQADSGRVVLQGMHSRYGRMVMWLFGRLFGAIDYPPERADELRQLSSRATLVYVVNQPSVWMTLYLNHALSDLELPLGRFVGGINLLLWQPVGRAFVLLRQRFWRWGWLSAHRSEATETAATADLRPDDDDDDDDDRFTSSEALLREVTHNGGSSLIVIPPSRKDQKPRRQVTNDFIAALLTLQREQQRPIVLVPHLITDRALGGSGRRGVTDWLFGDRRNPRGIRGLALRVRTRRTATVCVAREIDLTEVISDSPDGDDVELAHQIRLTVNRRLSEEEQIIAGPRMPPPQSIARRVLRDPKVKARIERPSKRKKLSNPAAVMVARQKARVYLKEIAANYDVRVIKLIDRFLGLVFNRIYDGVVCDDVGLRRVVKAARGRPVVFCPSHRSHVDYLVLSYLLWNAGLAVPHVAAGVNLSFFPVGTFLRRGGAFFLRRSFRGQALYGAVFQAYVNELIRGGATIEFFLEGGRSRTGKLLPPKLGLLGMVAESWRDGACDDLLFVPVSVDYERIVEADSYARELGGKPKKAESIGGLLRSVGVLRSRFGRLHVQFGEPISLTEFAKERGITQVAGKSNSGGDAQELNDGSTTVSPVDSEGVAEDDSKQRWRRAVHALAYRIMRQIASIGTVTPTALVATCVLGKRGSAIALSELQAEAANLYEFLSIAGARFSDSLMLVGTREGAISQAASYLVAAGMLGEERPPTSDHEVLYTASAEQRIRLNYYKNTLVNHAAQVSIAARALLGARASGDDEMVDYETTRVGARFLSQVFKDEFVYRVDKVVAGAFDETLAQLAIRGAIDVYDDGRVGLRNVVVLRTISRLLDSFVESYWCTVDSVDMLGRFPLWQSELVKRSQERVRRAFLSGEIKCAEAASPPLVEAAIGWLKDASVLTWDTDGGGRNLAVQGDEAQARLVELKSQLGGFMFTEDQ